MFAQQTSMFLYTAVQPCLMSPNTIAANLSSAAGVMAKVSNALLPGAALDNVGALELVRTSPKSAGGGIKYFAEESRELQVTSNSPIPSNWGANH